MASGSSQNSGSVPTPSPAELRAHLQSLLDDKDRQLVQVGVIGQRVIAQQMELQERVKKLETMTVGLEGEGFDEEDVYGGIAPNQAGRGKRRAGSSAAQLRGDALNSFRELAETIVQWEEETKMLTEELTPSFGAANGQVSGGV